MAGSLNLSTQVRSASLNSATELIDVTTLNDGFKAYLVGPDSASFSADGPMDVDSSTNAPYDVMTGWKVASQPITFMVGGTDITQPAWLIDGVQSAFDTSTQHGGTTDFSLSAESNGWVGFGYSAGFDTLTTTTVSGNVDLGAAGTVGALIHLHVTAYDSITSDTVLVEHSTTGSSAWTALGTFAVVSGVTSERIQFNGATKRYVRVTDTIVGSGSVTRSVAVAKL